MSASQPKTNKKSMPKLLLTWAHPLLAWLSCIVDRLVQPNALQISTRQAEPLLMQCASTTYRHDTVRELVVTTRRHFCIRHGLFISNQCGRGSRPAVSSVTRSQAPSTIGFHVSTSHLKAFNILKDKSYSQTNRCEQFPNIVHPRWTNL